MRPAILFLTFVLMAAPTIAFADDMANMKTGGSPADKAFKKSMQSITHGSKSSDGDQHKNDEIRSAIALSLMLSLRKVADGAS